MARSGRNHSDDDSGDDLYAMPPSQGGTKEITRNIGSSTVHNRQGIDQSQALHEEILQEEGNLDFYDPDQSLHERRAVRKGYRSLQKRLEESKSEFLNPDNSGLHDIFRDASALFKNVKQTSDATLDSRLLVSASDLALKKVSNLIVGSAAGIDVDEFVAKCMAFMKHANRPLQQDSNDHDYPDDELGEESIDWGYFGRSAAFKGNKRPATSDFLLGPLGVQKRIRRQKARTQGLSRRRGEEATKPVEVNVEDIKQSENNTLKLVRKVYDILLNHFSANDLEETGVNLFKVVINPESFGQTVENIFFVSFLAREGKVAIQDDDNGLPVLYLAEPATEQQHASGEAKRQQMIFSLTMWDWKQIIEIFGIDKSIIPTREKKVVDVGATGWYT